MTALQLDPSAQAPWTRTIFGEVLILMLPCRFGEADEGSRQRDLTDVDGDEKRFWDELGVACVRVDTPRGREHEAIDFPVIRGVVQTRRAPEDVDLVVVTAQKSVWAKAEDLLARVALDILGEDHPQAPPGLAVNLNRTDLLLRKASLRVEKRGVEVSPQRLAAEVSD